MKKSVTLNKIQKLYVLSNPVGVSCIGFDVLIRRATALAKELGQTFSEKKGTLKAYHAYQGLLKIAAKKNSKTGWRSKSELTTSLIGLENEKVEGMYFGEKIRFIVGKSTGYVPAHLIIKNRRFHG